MKFTIQREDLIHLIGKIQGAIPSKAVIPILSNVLIEADARKVTLFATDLTVSVKAFHEAQIFEEGACALPARRFFQLIRELTAPVVTIHAHPDGSVNITSASSHFRLNSVDKNEFPLFPEIKEGKSIPIPAVKLGEMLINTSFAAAKDDSRQVLNGVYFEVTSGKAIAVGTDGKRLAKMEENIDYDFKEKLSCIIPLKAVDEMIHLLDLDEDLTFTIMSDKIAIESDSFTIVSKLLSGQFPDYERVIPKMDQMKQIALHREELMTLLRQISLFTSDVNHSVKLTFDKGELKLAATSSEIGEGKVNMPVDYRDTKLDIAFNPHYFIDILRHCKEETVNFGVTDSFNPGSITDTTNAHFVLMPMRLNS